MKEKLSEKISLFSGIYFNVDKNRGLNGFCDYIISQSSEQIYLDVPAIAIVEANNENIISGVGQCIAEMYAARIFNETENKYLRCHYGAVTTGNEWKFIQLVKDLAYIDIQSYYMSDVKNIIGILVNMAEPKN